MIEIVAGFLPINVIAADSCPNAGNDSKVPGLALGVQGEQYSFCKRGDADSHLSVESSAPWGMPVVGHCQDPVNPRICGFQRAFGIFRCCLPLVSSNGIDSRMDCAFRGHSEKRCGETAGPCDPAAVGGGYEREEMNFGDGG